MENATKTVLFVRCGRPGNHPRRRFARLQLHEGGAAGEGVGDSRHGPARRRRHHGGARGRGREIHGIGRGMRRCRRRLRDHRGPPQSAPAQGGRLAHRQRWAIRPLPVLTGAASMPENARERLREAGALLIDADAIARAAGNAKCANVVLVGALAARPRYSLSRCGRRPWPSACRRRPSRRTSPPCARAEPSSRTRRENSMTVSQISVFRQQPPGAHEPGARPLRGRRRLRARLLRRRYGEYGILRFIVDKPGGGHGGALRAPAALASSPRSSA